MKIIGSISVAIIASFFFFPFYFTFLPVANTKMLVALMGLVLYIFKMGMGKSGVVNREMFILTICAISVSMASFVAMTVNGTDDDAFLGYVASMWTWIGAAYFVVNAIKGVHGKISVELVVYYLAFICVCQCVLAIMIDRLPSVKSFIDSFLAGEGFMGKNEDRLYGLGCALDVAGTRFASVLISIAFLLPSLSQQRDRALKVLYLLSTFAIISVIGNMIGRTTTIGMFMSICYLIYLLAFSKSIDKGKKVYLAKWIISVILLFTLFFSLLYPTNNSWRKNIEFGFEGFFSLVEKGTWEVRSNNQLKGTFLVPDNCRTWIVGEGYMGTTDDDPYYIGPAYHDFYKMTDVGYSRFLFYFGLLGLLAFSSVILMSSYICMNRLNKYKMMFVLYAVLNFIIWFKVSTDIFLVFAIFLCISPEEQQQADQMDKERLSVKANT